MTEEIEQEEELTVVTEREVESVEPLGEIVVVEAEDESEESAEYLPSLVLPLIFLTVTLLGGMRFGVGSNEFLFIAPPLICLVFGVFLMALFVRSKLIDPSGYFSESFPVLDNITGVLLLVTLFAASVQVFNSLIPEAGLPFWVVAFCFLWTLWNNLFAGFDAKRLLQSLGGLFVLAFAFKYMVLLNFSVEKSDGWWDFLTSGNITGEALSSLLSIPPFSPATGYLQFFALLLFLIGLYFMKPRLR